MRIATLIGKLKSGKWETLANPDVPIHDQKTMLKDMIATGGKIKDKAYETAMILSSTGQVKRARFFKVKEKIEKVIDDLTPLAEEGLKKVLADEGLKIDFYDDHEKLRTMIRAARAAIAVKRAEKEAKAAAQAAKEAEKEAKEAEKAAKEAAKEAEKKDLDSVDRA